MPLRCLIDSGDSYVATLSLQEVFEACQANKFVWLTRRDELMQAEHAYCEQLVDIRHSLKTRREIIDVRQ